MEKEQSNQMSQDQNLSSTAASANAEQPQMGTLANQSAAQVAQDVTASANSQKNTQPQNPFVIQRKLLCFFRG